MHPKPVGIGVVGPGGWADSFYRQALPCPDVNLVSCWHRRDEAAQKFAAQYGCRVAQSLDALIADPEVDAIAIFSTNNAHRQPTEAAAAAGKHVWTEKPIANTMEDAVAMLRACNKAGVTLMVGHSERYQPAQRAIKSVLDSGRLGKIALAEGHMSHSGGTSFAPDHWRSRRSEVPGGPLMQLAVHSIDTMHCFFGPTRSVMARSSSSLTASEIEDVFVTLLEFESGLLATVTTTYVSPPCDYFRIYGMGGNLFWEDRTIGALRLVTIPNDPWVLETEVIPLPEINPYAAEMTEFARAIRTATPPETSGKEGIRALAVVLGAIRSAEEGRPVQVSEIFGDAAELLA